MKISLNWLSDFVEFTEGNPQKIAERITVSTAEVDLIERQGAMLEDVCVGKVLTLGRHPNADRLSVCTIATDRGEKHVVCGGTNLRQDMRIAFAHVGATVRHGKEMVTLEKMKIRGEASEGMICAAEELELEDRFPMTSDQGERPIIDLGDGDAAVGFSLREYLGLNDIVLHIDNHAITHRPDLFSHIGFARECVAIGLAKWKRRPTYDLPSFPSTKLPFTLHNDIPALVPRYLGCLIEIDDLGTTPDWMVSRLAATGWRSLSLPIDITNFVSMEVGMPLHCFDADDFRGDVKIRLSKKGESIVTLDKAKRDLPDGAIVLSDDEGIFDLLGIMGGLRSSTKPTSRRLFLHSAIVDPVSIRAAIIATGHRTDASTTYEKGIPPVVAAQGFARALQLFLEYVPGARVVSSLDTWGDEGQSKTITLPLKQVSRMLGATIRRKTVETILTDLEFQVQAAEGAERKGNVADLMVTTPLHRRDIHASHDLVEEVGRIYGYNELEPKMPDGDVRLPERDFRLQKIRQGLQAQGFLELLPLSLISPELAQASGIDPADAVRIDNPLGEELSILQPSALPQLLQQASENMPHIDGRLQTFHVGTVFRDGHDSHREMGLLSLDRHASSLKTTPLLTLKRDLQIALGAAGYVPTFSSLEDAPSVMHPGRTAVIRVGDAEIGTLFELHPSIISHFDLPARTAVALVNVTGLMTIPPRPTIAGSFYRFPAITYDITIPMDHRGSVEELLDSVRNAHPLLTQVVVADLYDGKPLTGGKFNLTLRCTYRAPDRTLTEIEAQQAHSTVTKQLEAMVVA